MKYTVLILLLSLGLIPLFSEENAASPDAAATTNLPKDPFGDLPDVVTAAPYTRTVDRTRGNMLLDAKDGVYSEGSHFSNWTWSLKAERSGHFYVGLLYDSTRPKQGVQVKVGDEAILKSYAPRTNPLKDREPLILGPVHLPKAGDYPVAFLAGEQSNVDAFRVRGILFRPIPESEVMGQSIDGTIELTAKSATTYAETMRYESKAEKDCLGFWKDAGDWAEWPFHVSAPGKFEVTLHYGCGSGRSDSRIAVLVNDETLEFTIADTGGFQNWKEVKLGTVNLKAKGENRLAVVPLELNGKALMDLQKIVLSPVP